ncbi:hypothetical protein [Bdellovibrio sp. NC01]|uniref:hypothetical protein n=1 Tax=Bdellovibrio sp. NC01 TaxID=2220073 RepID=UPI00115B8844|nr:hypothetical protein [Bdellovibrio sp. NC01]QDK38973.1 hypothetical protein DOE51_15955 [Bdellovibrio sp. NC01]
MKTLFILALLFSFKVHADALGYGDKNCKTDKEIRGVLFGKEICVLNVTCDHYPLNNPDETTKNQQTVYCMLDKSNACPAADACYSEKKIDPSQAPMILPKYTGDSVGPIKSTGSTDGDDSKTCDCSAGKTEGQLKIDRQQGGSRGKPAAPAPRTPEQKTGRDATTGRGVQ